MLVLVGFAELCWLLPCGCVLTLVVWSNSLCCLCLRSLCLLLGFPGFVVGFWDLLLVVC